MSRELKFRGKTTIFGKWVNGDLEFNRAKKSARIHCYDNDGNYIGFDEVDPSTIGQYTGLKDKNGKEIYEGDIIKDLEGVVYEICWYADLAAFIAEIMESERPFYIYDVEVNKCEIVGNVHKERKEA